MTTSNSAAADIIPTMTASSSSAADIMPTMTASCSSAVDIMPTMTASNSAAADIMLTMTASNSAAADIMPTMTASCSSTADIMPTMTASSSAATEARIGAGESEQTAGNNTEGAGATMPLTDIEEIKKLIYSGEQQRAISKLEEIVHIRKQKNFKTLIKAAVEKGSEEILIWFVKNVYDKKNKNGALEMAVNSGIEKVIKEALNNGGDVNEGLYFAVKADNMENKLDVIKYLAQKANVNYVRKGYTLLHTAIMQNCESSVVEFLIGHVKDALKIIQELMKRNKDGARKEYLEKIEQHITLTELSKTGTFEPLLGLSDNLRCYVYQIKLLTLFTIVYTKLAISTDLEFELSTEAADQLPFDDISIKIKQNRKTNYQFVQVKQTGSPQYNKMKESQIFTILKNEKEKNVMKNLKGNDSIIKMLMAFDKISNSYLQNGTGGKFFYATNMSFENNSPNFFVSKPTDDLLCGVGGTKWQISNTYYVEHQIKSDLLNLLACPQYIAMIDPTQLTDIKKQIEMINNMTREHIINNNKKRCDIWSVIKIAEEGSKIIKDYLEKFENSKKKVNEATDEETLTNDFPHEFKLPQNTGNFYEYKTSCKNKIKEIYYSLNYQKAIWEYFSKWDDEAMFTETMNNFVKHFCIYTDCPNIEKLNDIITEKICEALSVHNSDIYSSHCIEDMSKWILNFKYECGSLYTHCNGKKLFSDLIERIFNIKTYNEDFKGQIKDISFKDNSKLYEFLSHKNNNKIHLVVTEHTRLHTIKVLKTLKRFELESSDFNYDRHTFFAPSDVIFESNDTVKMFTGIISTKVTNEFIILELRNVQEHKISFECIYKLRRAIADNAKCKIILIGNLDLDHFKASALKEIPNREYVQYNEAIGFENLTEESKKNVLERTVYFTNSPDSTGIPLKLKKFLPSPASANIIDEVLLSEIITKTNNTHIGNSCAFDSGEYNEYYYIPRTVHRQIIDKSVLAKSDKYLFFVTGICENHLKSKFKVQENLIHHWQEDETFDVGIFVLEDCNTESCNYKGAQKGVEFKYSNDDIFKSISDSCNQNAYWFDIRDDLIFLEDMKINIMSDRVNLKVSEMNKTISDKYSIAPIVLKKKTVILADDAGEGKSIVMTELARALKNKLPECWIVRVDLNNYVNKTFVFSLNNIEFTDEDTSKAVEFVAHMLESENSNSNSILERKIFEAALNSSSGIEVVLIFDGFDEISPDYKEKTCTLLKALAKSKIRQLWVTTRIHLKEYLEAHLQTPAFTLTQLSKDQVIQYLNQFWKWKLKNYNAHSDIHTCINIIDGALECLETGCENCVACGCGIYDKLEYILREGTDLKIKVSCDYNFQSQTHFSEYFDNKINFSSIARFAYKKWSEIQGQDGFLNVPLNLKMFAEIVFANKWCAQSFKNVKIFEIYKRFVDSKLDIYKHDKSTTLSGGQADKELGDIASAVLRDIHRETAVKVLFETSDCIPNRNVYKERGNLYETLSRVGLTKFNGDRFEFTHRTFAEYFFIEYLALNFEKANIQCEFLPQILIKKYFSMLRKLLNGYLSQPCLKCDNRVEAICSLKNLTESDEDGNNVLHIAVVEGHTHIFEFIVNNIGKCPDPDTINNLILTYNHAGRTCLHEVARLGRNTECDIILKTFNYKNEVFLKKVLTVKDSDGYTPVEYAIHYSSTDIVNLFAITAEKCISISDTNITDSIVADMLPNTHCRCDIILHTAAGWSICQMFDTMQQIREEYAIHLDESDKISYKLSALHLAAYKGDVKACTLMSNYLNKDQIIYCPVTIGTPLHFAAQRGHSEVCKLIINIVVNFSVFEDLIMKCDYYESTALHIAVWKNLNDVYDVIINNVVEYDRERSTTVLKYLLLKSDSEGRNVLHLAAERGYSEVCKLIINIAVKFNVFGDIIMQCDYYERTALHVAVRSFHADAYHVIINYAVAYDRERTTAILKYLLLKSDSEGKNVLHLAAEEGDSEACKLIINIAVMFYAFENLITQCDCNESTPLHIAVLRNRSDVYDVIINYVVEYDSEISTAVLKYLLLKSDSEEKNMLHLAAERGSSEFCDKIIQSAQNDPSILKALLKSKDLNKKTPLHQAANAYYDSSSVTCKTIITAARRLYATDPDILKYVLTECDKNNQTALHTAAGRGDIDTCILIVDLANQPLNICDELLSMKNIYKRTAHAEGHYTGNLQEASDLLVPARVGNGLSQKQTFIARRSWNGE